VTTNAGNPGDLHQHVDRAASILSKATVETRSTMLPL